MGDPGFLTKVFVIVFVLLSTAFHEMAHAFVATWMGDNTPARNGRLTLNPIPHLQPVFSAVILPVVLFLSSGVFVGLALTPINPQNFRHPLRDHALVAVAGPIVNILCSAVFLGLLWIPGVWIFPPTVTMLALYNAAFFNMILAVFNLMPLPPLDGYWIARYFLPVQMRMTFDKFARNPMSFIFAIVVGSALFRYIDGPLSLLFLHLLP